MIPRNARHVTRKTARRVKTVTSPVTAVERRETVVERRVTAVERREMVVERRKETVSAVVINNKWQR